MKWAFLFLIVVCNLNGFTQQFLILGNPVDLKLSDSLSAVFDDRLPSQLDRFEAVFVFSSANSHLHSEDVMRIDSFVQHGGGLYIGADNWPLMSESNQLTEHFYQHKFYGFNSGKFEIISDGELNLSQADSIYAGVSTVTFPLLFELRVEAWVGDNPVILSGYWGQGRIILDGGYSRFYHMPAEADFRRRVFSFLRKR